MWYLPDDVGATGGVQRLDDDAVAAARGRGGGCPPDRALEALAPQQPDRQLRGALTATRRRRRAAGRPRRTTTTYHLLA